MISTYMWMYAVLLAVNKTISINAVDLKTFKPSTHTAINFQMLFIFILLDSSLRLEAFG